MESVNGIEPKKSGKRDFIFICIGLLVLYIVAYNSITVVDPKDGAYFQPVQNMDNNQGNRSGSDDVEYQRLNPGYHLVTKYPFIILVEQHT